jgi:hypothetical protein
VLEWAATNVTAIFAFVEKEVAFIASCPGFAIDSVAPNAMIDFDWGFFKNSAVIANPLKGDVPILVDPKTFHGAFANTLSEAEAAHAFEETATHDSRNVLRDCLGPDGRIDLGAPHAPLLLIGGEGTRSSRPT